MRPTHKEYYLDIAKAVSKRSTCLRRQYGAVIVNNDEIIATGYNGAPRGQENCCDIGSCNRTDCRHNDGNYGNCRSVHAEMNCFLSASRREIIGGTLYLYGEENDKQIDCEMCPICQRLAINAGIKMVVYSRKNGKAIAAEPCPICKRLIINAGIKEVITDEI